MHKLVQTRPLTPSAGNFGVRATLGKMPEPCGLTAAFSADPSESTRNRAFEHLGEWAVRVASPKEDAAAQSNQAGASTPTAREGK